MVSIKLLKLQRNFIIENVLRHGCSPVNLLHILRTPFYKNKYGGLLLSDARRRSGVFIVNFEHI